MVNLRAYLLFLMVLVLMPFKPQAQTQISGTITNSMTFTPLGSPYIINGSVLVINNSHIEIQPGVEVRFRPQASFTMFNGTLRAIGTATDSIRFTADSLAIPGSWKWLELKTGVNDFSAPQDTGCRFSYCVFEYGGDVFNSNGMVITRSCDVSFEHCLIRKSISHGLRIINSASSVCNYRLTDCRIENNGIEGFYGNVGCLLAKRDTFYQNNNQAFYFNGRLEMDSCLIRANGKGGILSGSGHIANCFADSNGVGGIFANGNACNNCYVSDNIIVNNGPMPYSTGLETRSCPAMRNLVYGNKNTTVTYWAPAGVITSTCDFSNNLLIENYSTGYGGASDLRGRSMKNQIIGNVAEYGAAIYNGYAGSELLQNTITRNVSTGSNNPSTIWLDYSSPSFGALEMQIHHNNFVGYDACDTIEQGVYTIRNTIVGNASRNIPADSNYWGTIVPLRINSLIHDHFDQASLTEVVYQPALNQPDTSAPVILPIYAFKKAVPGGVELSWPTSLSPDVAGYRLWFDGFNGYHFDSLIDVGNQLSFVLLGHNVTETFGVSAYDFNASNLTINDYSNMFAGYESWFTITDLVPKAGFSISADSICQNDSITLTAHATNGNQYDWVLMGPGVTINLSGRNITNAMTVPGSYTIRLTVTNAYGNDVCQHIQSLFVMPNPVPNAGQDVSVCDTTLSVQIGVAPANGWSYLWTPNTALSNDTIARPIATVGQSRSFFLEVINTNGCKGFDTINLILHPIPIQPLISYLGPDSLCNGQQAVLVASSGYSSYLWSNGQTVDSITVTQSGSYSVQATDSNNCITGNSLPVNITILPNPNPPTILPTAPLALCDGDSVLLSLNMNYSQVQWSTGATSDSIFQSQNDTLNVEVWDAFGCSSISSVYIISFDTIPDTIPIIANSVINFCTGDSVVLSTRTNLSNLLWSNNETTVNTTIFTSGDYFVLSSNNCGVFSSDTLNVQVYPNPPLPVLAWNGNALTTTGNGLFQWFFNGQVLPGAVGDTLIPSSSGQYSVSVVDTNGCTNISAPIMITIVGVVAGTNFSVNAWPNPADQKLSFSISGPLGQLFVQLVNGIGQVVYKAEFEEQGTYKIDTKVFPSGTYFLQLISNEARYHFPIQIIH